MIAFISDIHSNLPALNAVLKDIDSVGQVEKIYCLGDVVGYGPEPIECLDIVASRCKLILMGNHEHAVLYGAFGFHSAAKRAIDWTRETLQKTSPSARRNAIWQLMENLPVRHEINDVLLVHGSPRDPVMEYVLESDLWEGSDHGKMEGIFAGFKRLCFVGHTHRPGVFTNDRCFLPASELPDGFDISDGQYLVNVGSVGQPRDHDPRACYALYSGDAVYWRRVAYDIDETAARFKKVEALDYRFAERLFRGE
ncbi:MAG: metallophosphoesterase family protein [Planctomycetes bacterium]|nr:metallophosphoesterase family protein [Planctomycetota bacterium]